MDRFTREFLDILRAGSVNLGGFLELSTHIEVENWFRAVRVGLDRSAWLSHAHGGRYVMSQMRYTQGIAGAGRQLLRRLSSRALVGDGAGRTDPAVRGFYRG